MVRAYLRAAQKYRDTHPNVETVKKYADVYEWFTREVLFEKQHNWEDHKLVTQFTPPRLSPVSGTVLWHNISKINIMQKKI